MKERLIPVLFFTFFSSLFSYDRLKSKQYYLKHGEKEKYQKILEFFDYKESIFVQLEKSKDFSAILPILSDSFHIVDAWPKGDMMTRLYIKNPEDRKKVIETLNSRLIILLRLLKTEGTGEGSAVRGGTSTPYSITIENQDKKGRWFQIVFHNEEDHMKWKIFYITFYYNDY